MEAKTLKQIQSGQTRQRILEEATRLFARKGFYGTSIAALAQAVGLTKGALYHHFPNKEAIFLAVVDSVRTLWNQGVANEVLQARGAPAQLEVLLDSHTRLLSRNEMLCLVMSNLMLEMEHVNPVYASVLQQVYEDLAAFIEGLVRAGQGEGTLRADLDPRLTALNLVGMLKGIGCNPVLGRLGADPVAMTGNLTRMVLSGLRA